MRKCREMKYKKKYSGSVNQSNMIIRSNFYLENGKGAAELTSFCRNAYLYFFFFHLGNTGPTEYAFLCSFVCLLKFRM